MKSKYVLSLLVALISVLLSGVAVAQLIAEGQVTLTAHAYFGVRGMPPKGGNPNLSIEGFADALVYIVNNSGGNWKSPDAKTIAAINKEVEARRVGANKKP